MAPPPAKGSSTLGGVPPLASSTRRRASRMSLLLPSFTASQGTILLTSW
jgi:hypothetical protein